MINTRYPLVHRLYSELKAIMFIHNDKKYHVQEIEVMAANSAEQTSICIEVFFFFFFFCKMYDVVI